MAGSPDPLLKNSLSPKGCLYRCIYLYIFLFFYIHVTSSKSSNTTLVMLYPFTYYISSHWWCVCLYHGLVVFVWCFGDDFGDDFCDDCMMFEWCLCDIWMKFKSLLDYVWGLEYNHSRFSIWTYRTYTIYSHLSYIIYGLIFSYIKMCSYSINVKLLLQTTNKSITQ